MLSILLLEPDLQLTPDRHSPSELLLFGKLTDAAASLYTFVRYVIIPSPQDIRYIRSC